MARLPDTVAAGARGDGLCAGRRPRHPADGADRPARQAGGLFRRQVAHHRFRAVERAELRHPPHRGGDAVQGAQPDPPPAARLELPPPRAQRELRHPAGEPARVARRSGTTAPPTPCTRTWTSSRATARDYIVHAGRRPHLQDGLRAHAAAARRHRRRRDRRLPRSAAHGGDRLRRDACRRDATASSTSSRSRRTRRACRTSPDMALASMGIYVFETRVPDRAAAPRRGRPGLEPRFRQGHHPLHRQERQGRGASLHRAPACARPTRRRPTGATSARSTPTGRPTST